METKNIVVSEKRSEINLPRFDITDVLTMIILIIIGALLMTDRAVPEYLIGLAGIGAGTKMFTPEAIKKMIVDK